MNASQRSDQVFQLSLTEIAFTIAFILLLLLGYLVARESAARKKAEDTLAKVQDLGAAQQAFNEASKQLRAGLEGAGSPNPDEVISNLVAEAKTAAERDRLVLRVKDLEAQISALSEVKQAVTNATKEAGKKDGVERVLSALAMQLEAEQIIQTAREGGVTTPTQPASSAATAADAAAPVSQASGTQVGSAATAPTPEETRADVRRSLEVTAAIEQALREAGAKPLPAGREAEAVAGIVRTAQSVRGIEATGRGIEAINKENADLRGQMANMRNRFNAAGRGLDHPPCWADEAGNIEYLFNVELKQGSVVVTPAWPERRRLDAEKLPGVAELTASAVNAERFRSASKPILDISKRQDPECRHFVVIQNTIETRREADQARWMVEEFFYKREARR